MSSQQQQQAVAEQSIVKDDNTPHDEEEDTGDDDGSAPDLNDNNSYCTVVRDRKWRASTFHMVFQQGSSYCDVLVANPADGSGAKTTNSSFDGEGCLAFEADFPQDLAVSLLALVPTEKSTKELNMDDPLSKQIEQFYIGMLEKVPADWRQAFLDCDVILDKEAVKHLLLLKK